MGKQRRRDRHPQHGLQQWPVVGGAGRLLPPLLQTDLACRREVLFTYPAQGHEEDCRLRQTYRTYEFKKVSRCHHSLLPSSVGAHVLTTAHRSATSMLLCCVCI